MSSGHDETRPLLALSDVDDVGAGERIANGDAPKKTPLPKLQLSILTLVHVTEAISGYCIFPFINQLVRELDITGGDEKKVGYYVGLIESIFFATQAMFTFHWGRLSDHIGRKPVLLIGLAGVSISMLCFGLSRTFWGLVVSRSIVGLLNGNAGVVKSMMGEITDPTNMAQGFALIPVGWSLGSTIAPWFGGQLSRPQDRWPQLFSHPFWGRFPYFLPCAVASAYAAFTFMLNALFLKETVKRRRRPESPSSTDDCGAHGRHEDDAPPPLRSVLTRPVLLSVACYVALGFIDIAFMALFPLFCATPVSLGGLGFDPPRIGAVLGIFGFCDGLFQFLFFSPAVDRFGVKRVLEFSLSMFVPMYALFPVTSAVARAYGAESAGVWALIALQFSLACVMDMSYGAIFMVVRSSVPNNRSLGAANGIAQFSAATMRAIAPAASTSLFATTLEYNFLGGYGVNVIFVVISIGVAYSSYPLPASGTWSKEEVTGSAQ